MQIAKKAKRPATPDYLQRSFKAACFLLGVFQCLNSVIELPLWRVQSWCSKAAVHSGACHQSHWDPLHPLTLQQRTSHTTRADPLIWLSLALQAFTYQCSIYELRQYSYLILQMRNRQIHTKVELHSKQVTYWTTQIPFCFAFGLTLT